MPIVDSSTKTHQAWDMMSKFQTGEIKPVSTGMKWLDECLIDGFLPGSVLTIGGLSNHGKTYQMQKIENAVLQQDPSNILIRCNWETPVYKLLLRKITKLTKRKAKDIMFQEPKGHLKEQISAIMEEETRQGVYYYEDPVTAGQFGVDMESFLIANPHKKIMISIDHVGLVKGQEKKAIDALFQEINRLKKLHPYVFFLPLMQLNRNLHERVGDHRIEAPRQSDFYGTDQLFHLSDAVIVVHNPYKIGAVGKYMVFPKGRYDYVDQSFIAEGTSKFNSFIPDGNYFYHALKVRDIDDMSEFRDVWVEKLFEVKQPDRKTEPSKNETEDGLNALMG